MASLSRLASTKKKFKPITFVKEDALVYEDREPERTDDPPESRELSAVETFDGHEWARKHHRDDGKSQETVIRRKKQKLNARKCQLHISFYGKRPPVNEIHDLHPDIINVVQPKTCAKFCFISFLNEEITHKAYKDLLKKKVNGRWLRVLRCQQSTEDRFDIQCRSLRRLRKRGPKMLKKERKMMQKSGKTQTVEKNKPKEN